jgi:hypothetical protein
MDLFVQRYCCTAIIIRKAKKIVTKSNCLRLKPQVIKYEPIEDDYG